METPTRRERGVSRANRPFKFLVDFIWENGLADDDGRVDAAGLLAMEEAGPVAVRPLRRALAARWPLVSSLAAVGGGVAALLAGRIMGEEVVAGTAERLRRVIVPAYDWRKDVAGREVILVGASLDAGLFTLAAQDAKAGGATVVGAAALFCPDPVAADATGLDSLWLLTYEEVTIFKYRPPDRSRNPRKPVPEFRPRSGAG